MRAPTLRIGLEAAIPTSEMIVDLFAGAGGASVGIERAAGRPADIAINHDADAIRMHEANHPNTRHFISDVFEVDPIEATGGRPVGFLWLSPDCKHFSRAKGQTPVSARVRALADVIHTWIEKAPPRMFVLENVEEFEDWGPLVDGPKGPRPDPSRVGETFRAWLAKIVHAGYSVEFKSLNAADYGAATTRRRLFLIGRRDRDAVRFPEATHAQGGAGGLAPWVPVHDVINWSHPTRSIFGRSRPLAANTMARIAKGLDRFVANEPFVVNSSGDQLTAPWLIKHYGGMVGNHMSDTLGTITARDSQSLATATLQPAATACGGEHTAAFLLKYFGTATAKSMREPLGTLTTKDRYALITVKGQPYRITDIGMRMLQPDELYSAQGFGPSYNFDTDADGRSFTKTQKIRFVGNSVSPQAAEAIVSDQLAA